jgi:hypothetical protein
LNCAPRSTEIGLATTVTGFIVLDFGALGVGNYNSEVRQEYGPCEAKPHKPAFDKDGRNNANDAYCHGDEIFHQA